MFVAALFLLIALYVAFRFARQHPVVTSAGAALLVAVIGSNINVPTAVVPLMVLGYIGMAILWFKRRFGHSRERRHGAERHRERVRIPVSSLEDDR